MKTFSSKPIALLATTTVLVLAAALFVARTKSTNSMRPAPGGNAQPRVVLWAWERPTDLRFIDPARLEVAFLARSIQLRSDEVLVRPRLQPLNLPESARVIPVVRIETDRRLKPLLSEKQQHEIARSVAELASLRNVAEVQIDFDATQSEREFYRRLLSEVRRRLPPQMRLSITALASWCMDDDWISDLPVDEAVPMLFRMAADGRNIADRLDAGEDFAEPLCRDSYGVALDERRPKLIANRRLYLFNPDAWNENSVRQILESK